MDREAAPVGCYIAFLRAINVGGHTVKMDALRGLFVACGLANVETFIASGNVIFDSPAGDLAALEKQIEAYLQAELGYRVETFIRSRAELAAIAAYTPFPPAELTAAGNTLYIGFLAAAPGPAAREKLQALRGPLADLHLHAREIYWLSRTAMSESPLSGAVLEKALGMPTTLRNANTVQRLAAKYPPTPPTP